MDAEKSTAGHMAYALKDQIMKPREKSEEALRRELQLDEVRLCDSETCRIEESYRNGQR